MLGGHITTSDVKCFPINEATDVQINSRPPLSFQLAITMGVRFFTALITCELLLIMLLFDVKLEWPKNYATTIIALALSVVAEFYVYFCRVIRSLFSAISWMGVRDLNWYFAHGGAHHLLKKIVSGIYRQCKFIFFAKWMLVLMRDWKEKLFPT